ncbi:dihydroorotate dehydrogenase electron transfer subunit [Sutcliffiella cohnii]
MKKAYMNIVSHEKIARNIYEMTLQGELVSLMNHPGQFVHIRVGDSLDPILRRPISIAKINKEEQTFTIVYRAEGKGTLLLSQKKIGDLVDVLGPLGNGFSINTVPTGEKALIVGGGIGVPPLLELSKQLNAVGIETIHVLGFQSKEAVFYEQQFLSLGDTYIATVDGSYGTEGFVTNVLNDNPFSFHTVFSCGPTVMLKVIEEKYSTNYPVFLSLEERMGCGIGACFACVCHRKDDPTGFTYRKVCTDGPVFPAGEVLI